MADPNTENVQEAEAAAALLSFFPNAAKERTNEVETPVAVEVKAEEIPVAENEGVEAAKADETPEPVSEPEVDDVAALKAQLESERKRADSVTSRFGQSVEWARNLALRKSSELDQRDRLLKRMIAGEEIPKEEVERLLASQQPAPAVVDPSANPFAPQVAQANDPALAEMEANRFFTEKRMDEAAVNQFVEWVKTPDNGLTQDDVVPGETYKTMRLIHGKYAEHLESTRLANTSALASAARVQKAVAKAASTSTGRAKPSPLPDAPTDPATQSPDEMVANGSFERAWRGVIDQGWK